MAKVNAFVDALFPDRVVIWAYRLLALGALIFFVLWLLNPRLPVLILAAILCAVLSYTFLRIDVRRHPPQMPTADEGGTEEEESIEDTVPAVQALGIPLHQVRHTARIRKRE